MDSSITGRRTGDLATPEHVRRHAQEDLFAVGIRVGLATLGPFGAIVGEFLTEFVPGQRFDRLQDFVEVLAERVADMEEQFKERLRNDAGFASLFEQTTVAAARTASDARRRDFASLLRHGLSRPEAETVEHHTLLRLVEQLNDAEIIILEFYDLRYMAG